MSLARNDTLPWWMPRMTGLEYGLIKEVLDINYLNEGDYTIRFENEISRLIGCKYAVSVTNCTAALCLALAGLDIGYGDEVIVPDLTFIATANAVTWTGAKPVLVDIDSKTLNISPEAFRSAITKRTKAVIPVHVSGRIANMPEILDIAEKYGIEIIEDAAEAFCSKSSGEYAGTFGKAGCFSFSPNKTITTGQGGVIVTDDDNLFGRLRELKDQGRPQRGTGGDDIHHSVGYNFKFTNLQSAVGLAQLSALHTRIERQKQIYRLYAENLSGLQGFYLPGFNTGDGEVPLWTDAVVERRDELVHYLKEKEIHCRKFWFPIHTQAPYRLPDNNFPNTGKVALHALWLPSAFTLSDDDVKIVCDYINTFHRESINRHA